MGRTRAFRWLCLASIAAVSVACSDDNSDGGDTPGDDGGTSSSPSESGNADTNADASSGDDEGVGDAGNASDGVSFLDLRIEDISAQRAVLRFDTSVETTCEAEYGADEASLDFSATDPSMDPDNPYDIEHEVPLEDLLPDTEYFVRARATDRSDDTYFSELLSFTTGSLEAGAVLRDNIALASAGTTISDVSSNFGGGDNSSTWGAEKAIDGMMGSEWATNGDGDDSFIVLDFGQERLLETFAFRSRKMTDGSSIITVIRLTIGDEEYGPFSTPNPDQVYKFAFDEPVAATEVRLDAVTTTGGNAGAKEIQFFAAVE